MEPYDPLPGRVPRKVAIDRKKKEYASFNLNQLFEQARINFVEKTKESWLPLHFFDDSTFDDYIEVGWIEKKVDEDGNPRRLTGKALKTFDDYFTYEPI
jgi:dynein heavy chain